MRNKPEDTWNTQEPYRDLLIPTQVLISKTQQIRLKHEKNKKHHGHKLKTKDSNTLRIYFQNINGLGTNEELKEYIEDMKNNEVDIWGWAETNVHWSPQVVDKIKAIGRHYFKNLSV